MDDVIEKLALGRAGSKAVDDDEPRGAHRVLRGESDEGRGQDGQGWLLVLAHDKQVAAALLLEAGLSRPFDSVGSAQPDTGNRRGDGGRCSQTIGEKAVVAGVGRGVPLEDERLRILHRAASGLEEDLIKIGVAGLV